MSRSGLLEWGLFVAIREASRAVSDALNLKPEILFYSIGVSVPITPAHVLPPLPIIPRGAVVVIEGRAPIWLYGLAFHELHGSPAAAIGVFDPRLGAVIVASHHPDFHAGQVLAVDPPRPELPAPGEGNQIR